MEILVHFRAVAAILKESIKLLPRNGKFIAFIALLSSLIYSSLFLIYSFSTTYLASDMFSKYLTSASTPSSAFANPFESIKKDNGLLLVVNVCFLLGIFLVSLFITITTVIVSATSYNNILNLSGKEFVLRVSKSWIRPFITSLYTALLVAGYTFVVIIMAGPILMFSGTLMIPIAIILSIAAYILYLYLNVEWRLALVVSVMEENSYGIAALGRASVLVKEKRLQGFVLNISATILSWILYLGFQVILGRKGTTAKQIAYLMYVSIFSCLIQIMLLVVYTVFYFHCKKENGEEMELQGSVGYKKLSTEPAAFSDAA